MEEEICGQSLGSVILLAVESIYLSIASELTKKRLPFFLTTIPILADSMGSQGALLEMIRANVLIQQEEYCDAPTS